MRRSSEKKGIERRKRARTKGVSNKRKVEPSKSLESCQSCSKNLEKEDRALFVEEEVGRIFCSEECISEYFLPEIKKLEKEYFRRLSPSDLSAEERENLAHLRWVTLQESEEVWREKTVRGDYRYTLISEFHPNNKKVWCVCICLLLKGEPSFLYMAFPTRNSAMVNSYRRGEQVERVPVSSDSIDKKMSDKKPVEESSSGTDGLADDWTEDETIRAQLRQGRGQGDIPEEEFGLYNDCMEETLEAPDEVWTMMMQKKDSFKLYHFIRFYPHQDASLWYVIVARETEDDEQIEILDAFPTTDSNLVDQYRRGEQEVGALDSRAVSGSRVVH